MGKGQKEPKAALSSNLDNKEMKNQQANFIDLKMMGIRAL